MTRMVQCTYLKKEAEGLVYPPYPGELGKRIYDNISKEAFELWKKHQTMLVNENRLNLADARARQYLARQMEHNRRIANGRLAEVFGSAALDADRFSRIVGFRRAAELDDHVLRLEARIGGRRIRLDVGDQSAFRRPSA